MLEKIKGERNFKRDSKSGAIINTNEEAYLFAKKERARRASLEQEVAELKALVYKLLNK